MIGKTLNIIRGPRKRFFIHNSIVNCRLREERGEEERGGSDVDGKMRGQSSPRASPGHSPVLNLSKSGNEPNSVGEPSERSELHSPNPSIREDDDAASEGNGSEVDDANDKDEDDGKRTSIRDLLRSKPKLILTFLSQNLFSVSASLLAFAAFLSASFVLFLLLNTLPIFAFQPRKPNLHASLIALDSNCGEN